jgi:hypothetical protein
VSFRGFSTKQKESSFQPQHRPSTRHSFSSEPSSFAEKCCHPQCAFFHRCCLLYHNHNQKHNQKHFAINKTISSLRTNHTTLVYSIPAIMTRALKILTSNNKCIKRRSSAVDSQYSSCGKKRFIRLEMPLSKPLPSPSTSTSCLNNLFSSLGVTRTHQHSTSKRVWRGIGSRKQRSVCLVTLLEECKQIIQCERVPLRARARASPLIQLAPSLPPQPKHVTRNDMKPSFGCGFFAETFQFQDGEDLAHPIEF